MYPAVGSDVLLDILIYVEEGISGHTFSKYYLDLNNCGLHIQSASNEHHGIS